MKEYSEEVKENIATTVEALLEDNIKHRLTEKNRRFKEANPDKEIPDVWRMPETVIGFLTKEKIEEMLAAPFDDDQMIYRCGLTLKSDGKAYFFSDDNCYGYNVDPSFIGVTFGGFYRSAQEGGRYGSLQGFIDTHCEGERYLGSVEELATYIVTGE